VQAGNGAEACRDGKHRVLCTGATIVRNKCSSRKRHRGADSKKSRRRQENGRERRRIRNDKEEATEKPKGHQDPKRRLVEEEGGGVSD